jgi:hypothetical protein
MFFCHNFIRTIIFLFQRKVKHCARYLSVLYRNQVIFYEKCGPLDCVADPDPSDPYVFEPPGSGSVRQRYGSGSFYHQVKIGSKNTLDSYFL